MSDSPDVPLSPAKVDQLHRSVKKHKRTEDVGDHEMDDSNFGDSLAVAAWQTGSFAEMLQRQPQNPPLYTGDGEEDTMDDLGITDIL